MDRATITHFAKTVNILTELPVSVFDEKNSETIAFFNYDTDFSIDRAENERIRDKYYAEVKIPDGKTIGYLITDDAIGIGKVKDRNSDYTFLIGGAKLADINKRMASSMIEHGEVTIKSPIPFMTDKFFKFIQKVPRVTPMYFFWMLSHINAALNHEATDLRDFVAIEQFFNNSDRQADDIYIKKREFIADTETGEEKIKHEKALIAFVRNGDIKGVNHYWHSASSELKSSVSVFVGNTLRQAKNNFISLISLISRAVVEEGWSENLACTLADSYIARAENVLSVEEFDNLIPAMLNDFTSRMRTIKDSNTDGNYIVMRTIAYIDEHITEKIVVSNIADKLKISNGYLASLFKKSTGMFITDYINKQKIEASKNMLENTDMSLTDISNYFSFSSQSYFQNLFKKYEGITPTSYRKHKGK